MLGTTYQGTRQPITYGSLGSIPVAAPRVINMSRFAEEPRVVLVASGKETKSVTGFGTSSYIKALAKLRYLAKYKAGWDGPGTKAAIGESFRLARDFLGLLPQFGTLFRLDAMIYAPGTAVLTVSSDDVSASLEFLPNGTIAANVDTAHAQIDADIFGFNGSAIPNELTALLFKQQQALAA
jgi:hypothetical protein